MKALDRKLLRDLRTLWSQALTIALVVASGVGAFITTLSAVDSLAVARDDFYASGRFADVFASVKRAPHAVEDRLRALPGVADVQTTIEQIVRIELDDSKDPVIGQLIGVDPRAPARMNLISLRAGRMLEPRAGGAASGGAIEALVSPGFAQARGLQPGARLGALINGKRRTLQIVGVALSPEFVFVGMFGMPDLRGVAVLWVDSEVLEAAYDMKGAFNRVAVKLAPGASEMAVIDILQQQLAPWGGRLAYGRQHQNSHAMLDNEIKEQHVLGTVLPVIFLGVAAFLLNVVVSRLVATQREQIAALRALGYTGVAIAGHYLKLVLVIAGLGFALGILIGDQLGAYLTRLYAEFFFFPRFAHRVAAQLLWIALAITLATAVAGTVNAVAATVRLAPAEAMRPPAPGRYRRTLAERLGLTALSPAMQMILRNMERRPVRTGLSVLGVACAVGIVVMGSFFRDAIDTIVDSQFNVAMRSDVIVWLDEPVPARARHELARLPGVVQVETGRDVQVRFINGHHSERGMIRGHGAHAALTRIIDVDNREASRLDDSGLVLTDRLAEKLGLRVGDMVDVEILEGRQRVLQVPVSATAREMMGLNAYMERHAVNRLLDEGEVSTWFSLGVERGREAELLDATRSIPRVAGAFSKATLLRNMQDVSARNVRIMSTMLTTLAVIIAVGVVYNNARIALSERSWELASLRVLGFSRAEVSGLLLGEMALTVAIALPLGWLLGWGLVHAVVDLLKSDQFHFPVVILPRTYAFAALAVLASAVVSALVVRRRIDRLDMVAALKTRE